MPLFGTVQKKTFLLQLSFLEFVKVVVVGITALVGLFVGRSITPIFGLVLFLGVMGAGVFFIFMKIHDMTGARWLGMIITNLLKTKRWKLLSLQHHQTTNTVVPDLSPFLVELKQDASIAYLRHSNGTGSVLLWELQSMTFINGLAHLPDQAQVAAASQFQYLLDSVGELNGIRRFGFSSFDTPSAGRSLLEDTMSRDNLPPSYMEIANDAIKKSRTQVVWMYVLAAPGTNLQALVTDVESVLRRFTVPHKRLTMDNMIWDLITRVSNPPAYQQSETLNSLLVPRPETIHPFKEYLVIDGRFFVSGQVRIFPRIEQPYSWWHDAQMLSNTTDISLMFTSWWDPIPASKSLKMSETAVQDAFLAKMDSQMLRGKVVDTMADRRMLEANIRSQEIASGASLADIGGGFILSAPTKKLALESAKQLRQRFQSHSADVGDCWGQQLEAFRTLMPFGLGRTQTW